MARCLALATGIWALVVSAAMAERLPAHAGDPVAAPARDVVVLGAQNLPAAFASATATSQRYPVGDPEGRSVAIGVTVACEQLCTAADPQEIADFLGTLVHASEMNLLKVELNTPQQIAYSCGAGVQACYYPLGNRMVINGNDTVAEDNATRDFVVAHEYGHHLANHRPAPPPGSPAISWGTPRWASYERVCGIRGRAAYFRNPGEAFAEAFAFNRFPDAPVRWAWSYSLEPDQGAFEAIREDALTPWRRTRRSSFGRRLRRGGHATYALDTPYDGTVTLRLRGSRASRFQLRLFDSYGRLLRTRTGRRRGAALRFASCGNGQLRVVVRRAGPRTGGYRLTISAP